MATTYEEDNYTYINPLAESPTEYFGVHTSPIGLLSFLNIGHFLALICQKPALESQPIAVVPAEQQG